MIDYNQLVCFNQKCQKLILKSSFDNLTNEGATRQMASDSQKYSKSSVFINNGPILTRHLLKFSELSPHNYII